jgi:energy-coupling factor transporter transmembrane protein EcfT
MVEGVVAAASWTRRLLSSFPPPLPILLLLLLLFISTQTEAMGEIVLWKYSNPYENAFESESRSLFIAGRSIVLKQNKHVGKRPLGSILWDGVSCEEADHHFGQQYLRSSNNRVICWGNTWNRK